MAFFSSNKIKIFVLSFFVLLGGMLFSPKDVDAACQVTDADFRSAVSYPTNYFTAPGNEPYVYIDISTTGCVGQAPIQLSISAAAGLFVDGLYYDDLGNFDDIGITVAQDNFSIYTKATNEECASNYGGWDCHYRLEIEDGDGESIWEGAYDGTGDDAMLSFDCWGSIACTTWSDWVLVSTNNTYGSYAADDNFSNIPETNLPTINPSSEYLAPLPGLAGQTPDLGAFLKGLFQVLIVIAGLLAMIMLVMGAITYLSSDAFSGKSSGKDMMTSAVFGLILALGAWVIINTINPNLASSLSIKIPKLKLLEGDTDVYNSSPTTVAGGTNTAFTTLPSDIGLYCPMTGGSAAIQQIITSFVGKVAYRWGGKGGPLPAGSNYPLSPSEVSNGAYKCTNDAGEKVPCNTFCPAGNVCLDCSGFVNHVRKCAGAPVYPTGTAGMTALSNAEAVDMSQLNATGTQIGSYVLVPGDILVWNGHVVIYFGNGKIAEAAGGAGGRQKGGNVKIGSIKQYKDDITHILKIQ